MAAGGGGAPLLITRLAEACVGGVRCVLGERSACEWRERMAGGSVVMDCERRW